MALTLEQVESAIETVLVEGQSVTIEGQTVTQANVQWLLKLRDDLRAKAAADRRQAHGRTVARRAPGCW